MPKLDRPKLEAALRRAAKVATTGPKSARSGRFVSTGPAKRLGKSLVFENVSSTVIDKIAYDFQRRQLHVSFVSGRTYVYDGVPVDTYEELLNADSQGGYFNREVRDAYEYHEVR